MRYFHSDTSSGLVTQTCILLKKISARIAIAVLWTWRAFKTNWSRRIRQKSAAADNAIIKWIGNWICAGRVSDLKRIKSEWISKEMKCWLSEASSKCGIDNLVHKALCNWLEIFITAQWVLFVLKHVIWRNEAGNSSEIKSFWFWEIVSRQRTGC